VTAIVERWYTEEQYTAAKEAHELAWQESDKPFTEPGTPSDRMVCLSTVINCHVLIVSRERHQMLASSFSGPLYPSPAAPIARFDTPPLL
jgi:hypothetical protein